MIGIPFRLPALRAGRLFGPASRRRPFLLSRSSPSLVSRPRLYIEGEWSSPSQKDREVSGSLPVLTRSSHPPRRRLRRISSSPLLPTAPTSVPFALEDRSEINHSFGSYLASITLREGVEFGRRLSWIRSFPSRGLFRDP